MSDEFMPHEATTPNPDPTILTTQQLQREIAASRDLLESRIQGLRDVIDTRLKASDDSIALLRSQVDEIPDQFHRSVDRLKELHEEKFRSIGTQFLERDTRAEQTSRDSKVAVDAALQAAKEAVGEQNKSNALAIAKSEAAFTKQIDQIGVLVTSMAKGIDDKIEDLKSRIQMMEGTKKGAADLFGVIVGGIGVIVGLGGVVIAIIFGIWSKGIRL